VGVDFTLCTFRLPLAKDCVSEVVTSFLKYIVEDNLRWDMLHIGPISGLYKDTDVLMRSMLSCVPASHKTQVKRCGVQTCLRLGFGWDEYLQSLGSKTRRNIRRSYKQAASDGKPLEVTFADERNFEDIFRGFITLHQTRWKKAGQLGHFGNWPGSRAFHHDVAAIQLKKKRLKLMAIGVGRSILAYDYSFKLGNHLYDYLDARTLDHKFSKIDIGKLSWSEVVKESIEDGIEDIDFMRGEYDYKLLLGSEYVPISSIYVTPKGKLASNKASLFLALSSVLNLLYYKIWCQRIASRLRRRRKPLWKIWIRTHWYGEHSA
jgi:CelD/BcsL family acetyltransferase involved in cellulose biosynthesis